MYTGDVCKHGLNLLSQVAQNRFPYLNRQQMTGQFSINQRPFTIITRQGDTPRIESPIQSP